MEKNKFIWQDSAHKQGLCIKCFYKKRLSWTMFLLAADIFFHILKAHLMRQTQSHDRSVVLMMAIKGGTITARTVHTSKLYTGNRH